MCKGNYGNEEYKEFLGKLNYYMQRKQDTVDATGSGTERTEMGRLRRMANIVVYASLCVLAQHTIALFAPYYCYVQIVLHTEALIMTE